MESVPIVTRGNLNKEDGADSFQYQKAMFERLWEFLSRHIKMAAKSVFFNFKQYCCFFAAILIVQLLFGMMFVSSSNNNYVSRQEVEEEYNYHYALYNLTQSQYNYLKDYKRSDGMGIMDQTKQLYVVLDDLTVERTNTRENKVEYDVYLRFGKLDRDTGAFAPDATVTKYRETFIENYVNKLASLEPSYSYQNFTTEETLLLQRAMGGTEAMPEGVFVVEWVVLAVCALGALIAFNIDKNQKEGAFTVGLIFLFVAAADILLLSASNNVTFWLITAVLIVLSVFLVMSIYNIRLNQYKFTYGVYMTFGADFKMLFTTAFWEMFVISLVTLIPSVVISNLAVWLIYKPSGFGFSINAWVILASFLFGTLVVLGAVFFPMRTTSARQPMSLIVTEDNSNLVTSPRKSFNLLGKSFPGHYEMYSIWRFRKYNIQLLTTAIIFCALFICGLYLANIYTTARDYPRPQFVMSFNTDGTGAEYDAVLSDQIHSLNDDFNKEYKDVLAEYGFDGSDEEHTFKAIERLEATGNATPTEEDLDFAQSPSTEAKYMSSFMLVNKNNIKPFASGFFVYDKKNAYSQYQGKGTFNVTNDVLYKSVDKNNLDDLVEFLDQYEIEGDVTQILESGGDTHYVIIGDSISNISKFKFKPGDTVAVSTYQGAVTGVDSNLTGRNLLRKQIQNFKYGFTELTVCAVIKDIPSGSVPVYMLSDTYEEVTTRSSATTTLNVYTYAPDPTDAKIFHLDNDMLTFVEKGLRNMVSVDGLSKIGSISVADTNQLVEQNITANEHYNELLVAVSILILLISPIIWFFSQILYYFKREKEFNVIQSLGANGADIRKIYLIGGLSMAVMSFIVSILLSYVASYIVFYFVNVTIPSFTGDYIRYIFYMPWYALVIAIVMSVACGFFSAFIPCQSYFKNRYSLENGGSGVKDDE